MRECMKTSKNVNGVDLNTSLLFRSHALSCLRKELSY